MVPIGFLAEEWCSTQKPFHPRNSFCGGVHFWKKWFSVILYKVKGFLYICTLSIIQLCYVTVAFTICCWVVQRPCYVIKDSRNLTAFVTMAPIRQLLKKDAPCRGFKFLRCGCFIGLILDGWVLHVGDPSLNHATVTQLF